MHELTNFVMTLERLYQQGMNLEQLAQAVLAEEFGITNPTEDQIQKMKLLISALLLQAKEKRDWSRMFV